LSIICRNFLLQTQIEVVVISTLFGGEEQTHHRSHVQSSVLCFPTFLSL
jgi:hypothetical protein